MDALFQHYSRYHELRRANCWHLATQHLTSLKMLMPYSCLKEDINTGSNWCRDKNERNIPRLVQDLSRLAWPEVIKCMILRTSSLSTNETTIQNLISAGAVKRWPTAFQAPPLNCYWGGEHPILQERQSYQRTNWGLSRSKNRLGGKSSLASIPASFMIPKRTLTWQTLAPTYKWDTVRRNVVGNQTYRCFDFVQPDIWRHDRESHHIGGHFLR